MTSGFGLSDVLHLHPGTGTGTGMYMSFFLFVFFCLFIEWMDEWVEMREGGFYLEGGGGYVGYVG